MKIRNIYTKTEITSKCCVINNSIFYVKHKNLYTYDFSTNTNTKLKMLDCHFIQSTKTDIVTVFNNKITVYNTIGDILNSYILSFVPICTKKYNNIVYIFGQNDLVVYNKNTFEKIRIVKKESLVDFCKTEQNYTFLTSNNKIFEVEDFIKTNRIMLNKEIHFFESKEKIKHIGYANNKYFLCFESSILVCKKKNNILFTYYNFENNNFRFVPFFDSKIYAKANGLFTLDEYPEKVISDNVVHLCENIAICEDKIVIIEENCEPKINKTTGYNLLKESDVDARVDALFELYQYNDTGSHKSEDLLVLKKEINEYKAKYLDKLKIIYAELKITNESFVEYARELENDSKLIEKRIVEIKDKREKIRKSMLNIIEKLKYVRENTVCNEDSDKMMNKVKGLRKDIVNMKIIDSKYILDKLKCQNLILKSFASE